MVKWLAIPLGLAFLGACFSLGARWQPWVLEGRAPDLASWGADVALSPDGRRVTTADSGDVELIDLSGVEPRRSLPDSRECYGVRFSADGQHVLAMDSDGNAKAWEVESGRLVRGPSEPKGVPIPGALSPDGELVAVLEDSGVIRIRRVRDGVEVTTLGTPGSSCELVRFSPDGTRVLTARGAFRMWDVRSGKELFHHAALQPWHLAFSSDGTRLLIDDPAGTVRVLDAWSGRQLLEAKVPLRVTQMAFIPGSSMAILVSNSCKADGSVRVLDTRSGGIPWTLRHTSMLTCVALSEDGSRVLLCGYNQADGGSAVWRRRRPEPWWGVAWLPEVWIGLLSAGGLLGITAQALRRRVVPAPEPRVPVRI